MKNLAVVATCLVICFLLCGFQQETSSSQRKPEPQVGSANKQKADSAKAMRGAPSSQPATDTADKNTTNAAGPHQNDKVDVTSLPPEIAVKQIKDSIDRTIMWCTIILTFVGIAGTVVAVWTLFQIKDQAKTLHEHSGELRKLAQAAQDNAAAAKASADAALLNVQAVINAQRAWILVEAKRWDDPKGFYFEAVNKGDTPAEILSAYVEHEFVQGIPDDLKIPPHYHSPVLIPVRGDNFMVRDEEWALVPPANPESWIDHHGKREAVMNASEFLCFYGEVNYRDTLRSADDKAGIHYTRWCFVYDVFLKIMVASGPRQYRAKS